MTYIFLHVPITLLPTYMINPKVKSGCLPLYAELNRRTVFAKFWYALPIFFKGFEGLAIEASSGVKEILLHPSEPAGKTIR